MCFSSVHIWIFSYAYIIIYGKRKTSKKTNHINKRDVEWNKHLSNSLSVVRSDVRIIGVKGSTEYEEHTNLLTEAN